MVALTIDGRTVEAREGMTILGAAKAAGVDIPTLCWMKKINDIGACRVCVVEVEGEERMAAACNTPVREGMSVRTNTPAVVRARQTNLQMILSEHRSECTTCARSETCALRHLTADFGIQTLPFDAEPPKGVWDEEFPLVRDSSKCIKCMRCVAECEKVQHCAVWDFTGSGPHMKVTVKDGLNIDTAGCALCGQCITHCPTGALTARRDIPKVMDALADPNVITVVQVAPAVRAAWGEPLGLAREEATPSRMAAALRALGFDKVFDTDFAADLTIMEEGSEFVQFMSSEKKRPMFTSCCPGWVRFAKLHYPQFVGQLSSAKSPHQMMGAVVKNTMKAAADEDGKRVFVVSIMPCVAKKYECDVPQLSTDAGRDVDAVLTVREFDRMLKMFRVDCAKLEETEFDNPLGLSTGAGTIFGRTGGVMEAALRSAVFLITGENPDFSACDTTASTPEKPWVTKELNVAGTPVRIAVASGLGNTAKLLDAIEAGEVDLDFVEIMACPGGCVGGGGQPIAFNQELAQVRAANLNALDAADTLRYSHENPDIQKLYADVLGEPLGHTSHEWLHTAQETWDI
ncbi:MAG: (2Fe-2S)-binding protein [Eggerthellaceae bacterium]|nr:(2Fe-2S)-binding protein [Eggerthellaceae bacterium]